MTGTYLFSSVLTVVGVALVLGASLHDVVGRTIPNGLVLALAIGGIATQAVNGHALGSIVAGGSVFLLAALCWRRGWMGGGDVKLLGAAAAAVPPNLVPLFIGAVAISGGLLALLYLAARVVVAALSSASPASLGRHSQRPRGLFARAVRVERWRISRGGPLPYACAIAAGFLFVNL
jgi:prepilin peptidase CpaA